MTLPGGWNDQDARSTRPTAAAPGRRADSSATISAQRCLAVTGGRALASERRCSARTQLGMPALTLPTDEPPCSPGKSTAPPCVADAVRPPARRGPPPLPARFAMPKVLVAATPLLPDTVPARRLQLQDDTCELDAADLLPIALERPATPAPVSQTRAVSPATAPRGIRGMMATVLVRLLSLLAPSLQISPAPGADPRSRRRQRR